MMSIGYSLGTGRVRISRLARMSRFSRSPSMLPLHAPAEACRELSFRQSWGISAPRASRRSPSQSRTSFRSEADKP